MTLLNVERENRSLLLSAFQLQNLIHKFNDLLMIERELSAIKDIVNEKACHHCGQPCEETFWLDNEPFCCYGCQTVFEILSSNNLCEYYHLDKNAGVSLRGAHAESFKYLDEAVLRKKIVVFESPSFSKVAFSIPTIHCVSCIWLLENLQKINPGILRCEVNFTRKTVVIDFNPLQCKLSDLAGLLSSLGYAPHIDLGKNEATKPVANKTLLIKLAVAGFCFGNVMLFSFPEYLGIDHSEQFLLRMFSWLNLALAVPVFLYSGADYFSSALKSFKQRQINIDVPIAAGLLALFLRSGYDIITATGPGYLDSFTGLVFFLLIGRWFQSKTYENLSFERDFKSYFPLAVSKFNGGDWKSVVIYELQKGDTIRIRNMEIIPADAILLSNTALIDYSFVTGESKPVAVSEGSLIYAGGRLIGQPVTLKVEQPTSQSHLTSLWNNEAFRKREENQYQKVIDRAARKFTWVVMGIAVLTGVYWYWTSPSEMWLVLTSVLMVACPCALALAAPFTYGTMLRSFGRNKLYLKNADVIERMVDINAVVFDKTGTVTYNQQPDVKFIGYLSDEEMGWVKSLTSGSTHPLSKLITTSIAGEAYQIESFKELPARGIDGIVDQHKIKIGSSAFVGLGAIKESNSAKVFVSIDEQPRGYFTIALNIRNDIKPMITRLGEKCMAMLSGDHETDMNKMKLLFGCHTRLMFHQSPQDKLDFIRNLQHNGHNVLMVGDGLNDSGALKQADVGIAVTDDTSVFTPACDGIIQGDQLKNLDKLLALARSSSIVLKIGFIISFFYNAIALSIAVSGHLTPLVAAILMPISSISVVGFSSLAVQWVTNRKLNQV
jgi:Cu+-exporting ATPase